MVYVPGGEFLMGSDVGRENEKPQRRVYLNDYWIYQYPVTVKQFDQFCRETNLKMPERPEGGWYSNHPVVNVSWDDAVAYCKWAGASLPSEAEWEKAARGTDGREFPWGEEWDPKRCQCSDKVGGDAVSTSAVTAHPAGVSPYGAMDMAGNVWEGCADWNVADYYGQAPSRNPTGPPTGSYRVLRGGGWGSYLVIIFRCACRLRYLPDYRDGNVGFRCVVRTKPSKTP
jgi:sulfatase modifying factor 1